MPPLSVAGLLLSRGGSPGEQPQEPRGATFAGGEWPTPPGGLPQNALEGQLPEQLKALIAHEGQRLARQVQAFVEDLVPVFGETWVVASQGFLCCMEGIGEWVSKGASPGGTYSMQLLGTLLYPPPVPSCTPTNKRVRPARQTREKHATARQAPDLRTQRGSLEVQMGVPVSRL